LWKREHDMFSLFLVSGRSYYDDDGGGSDSYEKLIDTDTDEENLRCRANTFFEGPIQVNHYRAKMQIPEGKRKSNGYSSNGGGCLGYGHLEIRDSPRLTPNVKLTGSPSTKDKGDN
jgi:hypothetical protein